ncbi:MAG: sigma 54-interacting transcriptional regulator [Candidatus Thiodiazotropha sp.]
MALALSCRPGATWGAKCSRLQLVHSGTLFLDEVGEIPPDQQDKEQMDQGMAWNKANSPKMHDMVISVVASEKQQKKPVVGTASLKYSMTSNGVS